MSKNGGTIGDLVGDIDNIYELVAFIFYAILLTALGFYGAWLSATQGFDSALWVGAILTLGLRRKSSNVASIFKKKDKKPEVDHDELLNKIVR